jgi:SOS response regulatory protein OraA/RecX
MAPDKAEAESIRARECALRLLDQRPHAVAELRRKLRQRHFAGAVIEALIDELQRLRLLDDDALAQNYCQFKRRSGAAVGRDKVKSDLLKHGIRAAAAEAALADHWDEDGRPGELARARQAAAGKMRSLRGESDVQKTRAKLVRFLLNRGFALDVGYEVVRELLDSRHE